jgi:hypothetical protein
MGKPRKENPTLAVARQVVSSIVSSEKQLREQAHYAGRSIGKQAYNFGGLLTTARSLGVASSALQRANVGAMQAGLSRLPVRNELDLTKLGL